jgi:hypothetical protein
VTRTVVLSAWVFAALLLVGCEVLSAATDRRYAGMLSVLERLAASRLRFVLLFVGWMWLGWHFFAR